MSQSKMETRSSSQQGEESSGKKLKASCYCGSCEMEATLPPRLSTYCHCTICQKTEGNFMSSHAVFDEDKVRMAKTDQMKTFKIEEPAVQEVLFCGNCGTHVAKRNPEKKTLNVPLTLMESLDDEACLPTCHINMAQRNKKFLIPMDGLPKFKEETDGPILSEEELQQEGLPAPAAASPSKRARVESQQKDIAEVGVSAGGAEAAV